MSTERYYQKDFINCGYLASGGFGTVSRARHALFNDVALKIMDREIPKAAKDEIANLVKVRHPNIVEFYGTLLNSKDVPIGFVMAFMADGSLHSVVHDEKSYQTKQAYLWIAHSATGLAYLHYMNIVHRDVKPLNILLSDNKKSVKICDLGISRDVSKMTTSASGSGPYMSPEAWNDPKSLNYSADVWSLGVTFWEVLRRKYPPVLNTNGIFHLEWTARSDAETGDMIKKMLAPLPEDRPSMETIKNFGLSKSERCNNGFIRAPIEKSLQCLSLGSSSSSSSSLEKKATIDSWLLTTKSLSQKSANRPEVLKLAKKVEQVTGEMKRLNRLKKPSSIEQCLQAVRNMMSEWLEAARKALPFIPQFADYEQEGKQVLASFEQEAQNKLKTMSAKNSA